jgi:hypothetical protein
MLILHCSITLQCIIYYNIFYHIPYYIIRCYTDYHFKFRNAFLCLIEQCVPGIRKEGKENTEIARRREVEMKEIKEKIRTFI